MTDSVFVDTNIWVYAKIKSAELIKHEIAVSILRNASNQIFISTQVINEFYTVLVRNRIEDRIIQNTIHQMLPEIKLQVVSLSTIIKSWELKLKYHYSVYDSLIIAAALEADCGVLLSEDMHHNQLIEGKLRIINPFL